MNIAQERDLVEEWMFRCYGATVNISARLHIFRKKRWRVRIAGWTLPVAVTSFASWLGVQNAAFQSIFWYSGGIGVLVALALVYDQFYLEPTEQKLQAIYEENMRLALRAPAVQRLKDADFRAEVRGFFDACEALSMKEQNEFSWSAEEDRAGLRAALFNFQALCNKCGRKPPTKDLPGGFSETTHCLNCGERNTNP